jgi:hypothetical protein
MNVDAPLSRGAFGRRPEFPADLDPALPGLARLLDTADVARRFERRWPGRGPAPSITACATQHIRWTPGTKCVATYRLVLAPSPLHPHTTIGVVEMSADGDRHFLFDHDPDLSGLQAATDPGAMGRWFAERLGRPVDACSITPVTYRPGRRCVIRYELSCGDGSTVLYGKLLAGDRSRDLASTVASLGESIVPSLVAVAPEWQLVVQADGGRPSLASDPAGVPSGQLLGDLRGCGRLLARLHARREPSGRSRLLADDADELRRYLPAAQRVSPTSAELLAGLIERVRRLDDPPGPAVPSHGACRLDQVRFSSTGPAFIDLDSYCWAEPARDLANFLAYQRWRALRGCDSAATAEDLRAAIVAGYGREADAALDEHRLAVFEAASLLKIAGRRYRRLAADDWDRVPDLIDAAGDLLLTAAGKP